MKLGIINMQTHLYSFKAFKIRLWFSLNQLFLPSIALDGAITSKLCNIPNTSNPVANMLATVRNIVVYLERILVINRLLVLSKLEVADRRRRVIVPKR